MKHKNLYDEKEGTEGNELKAAKEKTPEKSDVGTVESTYLQYIKIFIVCQAILHANEQYFINSVYIDFI